MIAAKNKTPANCICLLQIKKAARRRLGHNERPATGITRDLRGGEES